MTDERALGSAPSRSSFLNRIEPLWTIGWKLKKSYKETAKYDAFLRRKCPAKLQMRRREVSPCNTRLKNHHNPRFSLVILWKIRMPELLSFILTPWHKQVTMELNAANVTKPVYTIKTTFKTPQHEREPIWLFLLLCYWSVIDTWPPASTKSISHSVSLT